jgi:uncharacterized membrane protein
MAATATATVSAEPAPAARLRSVDIVRGAVMVLMAIDHVRVYAGVPAGGPWPGVFFTRWVTHFCAPVFVFLAGTSACFHASRRGSIGELQRWLLTRGAWLVLLELTVVRFFWTFNFAYDRLLLAGVLWVIGWCMIAMALLVRLPVKVIGALGLLIVAGHNLAAFMPRPSVEALLNGRMGWLWRILYFGGPVGEGPTLFVLYSFVPWIGVMAAGYAFGAVLLGEAERRRRLCFVIGLGATAAFVVLRLVDVYGDRPWSSAGPMPVLAFLNTTKYPASLLFLLMTLGPAIALMPLLENASARWARWLEVFGRVPFFYYLLHIPLIHLMAVFISLVRTPADTGWLFQDHPVGPPPVPQGYTWSLTLLYTVTSLAVVTLYPLCRWFAALKRRRRDAWLSYL